MFRRYWINILAIGVAVVLVGGLAWYLIDTTNSKQIEYEQSAKSNSDNYDKRRDIIIGDRCKKITASDKKAACINEERDAARKGTQDERDLEAQLTTAAWTSSMGIAAIVGMAASLIGVMLVFITFHETRKSNEIAQRAQRPWISITIIPKAFKYQGKGFFVFDVVLKNVGSSAATYLNFLAEATFGHLHEDDATHVAWENTIPPVADSRVVLLPGETQSRTFTKLIEFGGDKLNDKRPEASFDPIITVSVFYKLSLEAADWRRAVQSFVLRRNGDPMNFCNSYEVVAPELVAIQRSGLIAD